MIPQDVQSEFNASLDAYIKDWKIDLRKHLESFKGDKNLDAGGEGSGCHGDNCGRPSTGAGANLPKGVSPAVAKAVGKKPSSWSDHKDWRKRAYGAVMVNNEGKFLLREPSGHFDGYHWTWPKGKMDTPDEHPVDVATREVSQETGFHGNIFGHLPGTYTSGSGSWNNFYLMRPKGRDVTQMDKETKNVKWATYEEAKALIKQSPNKDGRKRDLAILDRAQKSVLHFQNKKVEAGGPGSGCHGDNCGRPQGEGKPVTGKDKKNVAQEKLAQGGWKKVPNHPAMAVPGKAQVISKPTVYEHPVHGKVLVGPNNLHHFSPTGAYQKYKTENVEKFAEKHAMPKQPSPAVVPPSVPKVAESLKSPPAGMHQEYETKITKTSYKFDEKTGMYHTPNGGMAGPEKVQKWAESGDVTPKGQAVKEVDDYAKTAGYTVDPKTGYYTKSGPPEGMPTAIKGPKGGTYTWDDTTGKYEHATNPAYAKTVEVMQKNLSTGDWKVKSGNVFITPPPGKFNNNPMATPIGKPQSVIPKESEAQKPFAAPKESTTNIPPSLNLTPDQFQFKSNASSLGGAHEKYIFTDKNNNEWLFKPATTIAGQPSPLMAHADEMAARIAQAIRPGYAIEAKAITMNVPGKGPVLGSVQKMIPLNQLRGEGGTGKFKDFVGRNFGTHPLADWEAKSLQQEQVLDWLISNHDAHGGQFLRTSGQYVGSRSVIGIDKSQAFKFLGKDELSTTYHPNTMEKPPLYNEMFKSVKDGKLTIDPANTLETIKKVEGISDHDYKGMLSDYTTARFGNLDGPAATKFLDEAISRKNNIRSDFEKFYSDVLKQKGFKFEPPEPAYDPNAVAVAKASKGTKPEYLPDHEERPNYKDFLGQTIPTLESKYSGDKGTLSYSSIHAWQSAYNYSDPTLPEAKRWEQAAQGKGLYPELAAKMGLLPADLTAVHEAISNWSSTTSSSGAAHIRAGAQDIMNNTGGPLKSRFSSALQLEHEVTKVKLLKMHPGGTMHQFRGLGSEIAIELKKAQALASKTGGVVAYHTMGAEGWSDSKAAASGFKGYSGVMLEVNNIPIANVITSHKTTAEPHHHKSEKESFISFPNKVQYLKSGQIQGMVVASGVREVIVDGTKKGQSHTSISPGTHKGAPKEVIQMQQCDKDGNVITSKKALEMLKKK